MIRIPMTQEEATIALKPGETEERRDARLAHNMYMRFYRSVRSVLLKYDHDVNAYCP